MTGGQKVVNVGIKRQVVYMHDVRKMTFKEIGKELGLAEGTVKTHYYLTKGQPTMPIPQSPYPVYNEPPVVHGDALILPDCEIPFHHADFINRVLEVAQAWGIKQMIAAGDLLHFDSLSGWEPSWTKQPNGGLTERDEEVLMDIAMALPKKYQPILLNAIVDIGTHEANMGFDNEMFYARKTLGSFDQLFDNYTWVLGNHEGRWLRALNSPTTPTELLNLMRLDEGKWSISPYYYCILESYGQVYRIEHPKSAAKYTAEKLASKFQCHVLMGHSHLLRSDYDVSGRYHACHIGHCVDEERLAYAAQRSSTRDAHLLGAAIVRDGYLWILDEKVDWEKIKKL